MPKTPEMVEAVARAISGAPFSTAASRRKAVAAIQAMREPPEAVLGAIHDKVRIECRPAERAAYILNADEMWAAGIDAALASPEEPKAGGKESLRTAPVASPDPT